ncbi:MAG: hypothetical protein R3F48_16135 [Candidatus Zixiibacteriota bacterium]
MRPINLFLILSLVCLLGAVTVAEAQIIYGQPASGDLKITYTSWKYTNDADEETTISQFLIPIGGFIPLQDNMELRFQAANTTQKAEYGDTENKLSGLTDLRLQLNKSLSDDKYLLSLGLNLPTGKKELTTDDEVFVMAGLSENYLSFPVRLLGEGFGFNMLAGGAMTRGNSRLGGTVMFQYNGKYKAYENEGEYDPGEMFSVSVNADTKSEKALYSLSAVLTLYTDDKLNDNKIRKSSTQVDFLAGAQFPGEKLTFAGNARLLLRGRNTSYVPNTEEIEEQLRLYGNELTLAAALSYHPAKTWSFTPKAELRMIGGNEYESTSTRYMDASTIFGLGGSYARKLGEDINGTVGFKYYTGSADGGDYDLSGYQFTLGLQAAF